MMKEILILETLRVLTSLTLFAYASWSDYKSREVSNKTWILFAPPAFALTLVELLLFEPSQMTLYGMNIGITTIFAIILFYSGGFGGADAKALMYLALALPFYPANLLSPLSGDPSPTSQILFPLAVFSNAVLLAALTAIAMLLYNVFWHWKTGKKLFAGDYSNETLGRKILILITGYKVSISKLKEKWHIYPLEDIENGEGSLKRKLIILPKDEGRNATIERLEKAVKTRNIQDAIWATPGLPFLVFVTLGLVIALVLGDVVWVCIRLILG